MTRDAQRVRIARLVAAALDHAHQQSMVVGIRWFDQARAGMTR